MMVRRGRVPAVLIGVAVMAVGGWVCREEYVELTTWPTTDAVVVTSQVVMRKDTQYVALVTIRYAVGGKEHVASVGRAGFLYFKDGAEREVRSNPPGAHQLIQYDKSLPSHVLYRAGFDLDTFWLPLFILTLGMFFFAVGALPDSVFADRSTTALSGLPGVTPAGFDLASPPRGAWFRPLPRGFEVGASTRRPLALILVPLEGILLDVILHRLAERPDTPLFFAFLFSLLLLFSAAMTVAGQVRVTLDGEQLTIFTGVGPLGWTQRYRWSDFRSVREAVRLVGSGKEQAQISSIVLEGTKPAEFGDWIASRARRLFIFNVLRTMLTDQRSLRFSPAAPTHGEPHLEDVRPSATGAGKPEGVRTGMSPEGGVEFYFDRQRAQNRAIGIVVTVLDVIFWGPMMLSAIVAIALVLSFNLGFLIALPLLVVAEGIGLGSFIFGLWRWFGERTIVLVNRQIRIRSRLFFWKRCQVVETDEIQGFEFFHSRFGGGSLSDINIRLKNDHVFPLTRALKKTEAEWFVGTLKKELGM